jgi:DNA-directed RNA polymerase subunit RPC12/RpoP
MGDPRRRKQLVEGTGPRYKKAGLMAEFKFECPHCHQHMACDEQFSGRQIQCPGCNHLINIPHVPGKTAEYRPESGQTWATFMPPANLKPPPKN